MPWIAHLWPEGAIMGKRFSPMSDQQRSIQAITIDAETGGAAVRLLLAARRFRVLTAAWQKECDALRPGMPYPTSFQVPQGKGRMLP